MAPEKEQSGLVSAPTIARKKYEFYLFTSRRDVEKKRLTFIIAKDGFQQGQTSHSGDEKAARDFSSYLDTLVLLGGEYVGADGSHRHVGSDQVLVLVQEGKRVHPAEGGTDHHRWGQAQTLAHLLQEGRRGQFSDGCRGLGCLGLTESWGYLETSDTFFSFFPWFETIKQAK